MDGMEKLKEKLKLYLSTLSENAQNLLLRNLEKAEREGKNDAAAALIVAALRDILNVEEKVVPLEEFAKVDFFRDARYFASEYELVAKQEARINPLSFEAIWNWIKRDIATPEQTQKLQMDCSAIEKQEISRHSSALCAEFVASIKKKLKLMSRELAGEQKLANQLGGEIVYKDLLDILISSERLMPLKPLLGRLNTEIDSWTSPEGEEAYKLISRYIQQAPLRTSWLVSALSKKLASPRQKLQLATKLSGSDDAVQVAATVYAPAVHQVFADMNALTALVEANMQEHSSLDEALKYFSQWTKLAKAVSVELELPAQSAWGKTLTDMKKKMSGLLKKDVEAVPGLVRRALRAPKNTEEELVDEDLVADAIRAAKIFHQAELAKDYLAMNGPISDARKELDQAFEILTTSLVERTRQSAGSETIAKLHSAAVDLARNVFDEDYANAFKRQLNAAATVKELQVAEVG
nr:hypothetical protein [uncultured Cohaesibacter sp.]